MAKSFIISISFFISFSSFSQKLNFSDLDHIPELQSNTSFYWSQNQCWIIPSIPKSGTVDPTGNILAYSFFNESFKTNHHCGPSPRTFEFVNDSLIYGATFNELFAISPFGVEMFYEFSAGNERIIHILPSTTDTILFSTDKGLYRSIDKGQSFDEIEEFSNSFFLQTLKVNDIFYSIFLNNSNYFFQSRNSLGQIINSIELDFTPFAFMLFEDLLYFTSTDSEVISLDLTFSTFNAMQIPDIGETAIIKLFQDQLFIYKFREQEVLSVDEKFNILSTESVSNSKLLFSSRNDDFYLYVSIRATTP